MGYNSKWLVQKKPLWWTWQTTLIRQNYIDFFTVILICQCIYCYFFKLIEYILRNTDNRKYLIEALFVRVTNVVVLCVTHTQYLWIVLFGFLGFFYCTSVVCLFTFKCSLFLKRYSWSGKDWTSGCIKINKYFFEEKKKLSLNPNSNHMILRGIFYWWKCFRSIPCICD